MSPLSAIGATVAGGGRRGGIAPRFEGLTAREAAALFEGLVLVDLYQLQHAPELRSSPGTLRHLQRMGLLRRTPPNGATHWRTLRELLESGEGDDVAFAAAEAAAARFAGVPSAETFPASAMRGRATIGPRFAPMPQEEAECLLYGLFLVDLVQLQAGVPPISAALHTREVRYIRYDPRELWQTLRQIHARGGGDCEDLAAAVAAELTMNGQPARPTLYRVRPGLLHAVTLVEADQVRIDPSRTGGMGEA